MRYAIIINSEVIDYSITATEIIRRHRDTSFPSGPLSQMTAEGLGYTAVSASDRPAHDHSSKKVVETTPALIDGIWKQQWQIVPMTPEEIYDRAEATQQAISDAVQARLDDFAKTRGYDNIVSACSYATSTHAKYGPEGRYCVSAREATWDVVFAIRDAVIAGTRPMPTSYADIEAELPVLVWHLD